jgi:two-component system nitrate/nitrite sensor histidine kinase NarX
VEPQKPRDASDLTEALHKRDDQLDVLNRLSAIISQSESLEKALVGTLDQLLTLTEADIGSVHVLDPRSGSLKLIASRGVSQGFIYAEECIPVGDCLCGEAAQTGELVSSPDLSAEPRLSRSACRDERFGSVVSIPLKSRDRVLGILTIYAKRPHCFSEMDRELLVLVGRQIGVAIENAQLYARTRELAVLEERGLIAQEIHDGIAQSLAYLNLETKRLEKLLTTKSKKQALSQLDHIREVIKDTYEDVRELLVDFRTKFKEGEGLYEALSRYTHDFTQRTGIQAKLIHTDHLPVLGLTAQGQVFRIVQEALSNVRKHAEAREVQVSLNADATGLQIEIKDDGRGFDTQDLSGQVSLHLGLEIMRERAANLRGVLELQSERGGGTVLRIRIPVEPSKE